MTSNTLQIIAEVKMHLRDSHAASWKMKQKSRTKRQFGPAPSASNQELSLPATPNSASVPMPPPPTLEKEAETENDIHPIGFREMVEDFNSLATEGPDMGAGEGGHAYSWENRGICDLFDFTSNYWIREHSRRSQNHLDEECNFYEHLSNHDVDAAGVEESQFCDYV